MKNVSLVQSKTSKKPELPLIISSNHQFTNYYSKHDEMKERFKKLGIESCDNKNRKKFNFEKKMSLEIRNQVPNEEIKAGNNLKKQRVLEIIMQAKRNTSNLTSEVHRKIIRSHNVSNEQYSMNDALLRKKPSTSKFTLRDMYTRRQNYGRNLRLTKVKIGTDEVLKKQISSFINQKDMPPNNQNRELKKEARAASAIIERPEPDTPEFRRDARCESQKRAEHPNIESIFKTSKICHSIHLSNRYSKNKDEEEEEDDSPRAGTGFTFMPPRAFINSSKLGQTIQSRILDKMEKETKIAKRLRDSIQEDVEGSLERKPHQDADRDSNYKSYLIRLGDTFGIKKDGSYLTLLVESLEKYSYINKGGTHSGSKKIDRLENNTKSKDNCLKYEEGKHESLKSSKAEFSYSKEFEFEELFSDLPSVAKDLKIQTKEQNMNQKNVISSKVIILNPSNVN